MLIGRTAAPTESPRRKYEPMREWPEAGWPGLSTGGKTINVNLAPNWTVI